MRFLSIDPGVTTGYCLGVLDESTLHLAPAQQQLSHRDLWNLLNGWNPHYAICEDFEYRPGYARPSLILVSLEYIGVVKLWGEDHVTMQKASQGKGFFNNDRLKQHNVYIRGIPHGMDALRHMLHWFKFGKGYQFTTDKIIMMDLVEEYWIRETYAKKGSIPIS